MPVGSWVARTIEISNYQHDCYLETIMCQIVSILWLWGGKWIMNWIFYCDWFCFDWHRQTTTDNAKCNWFEYFINGFTCVILMTFKLSRKWCLIWIELFYCEFAFVMNQFGEFYCISHMLGPWNVPIALCWNSREALKTLRWCVVQ